MMEKNEDIASAGYYISRGLIPSRGVLFYMPQKEIEILKDYYNQRVKEIIQIANEWGLILK